MTTPIEGETAPRFEVRFGRGRRGRMAWCRRVGDDGWLMITVRQANEMLRNGDTVEVKS